MLSFYSIKLTRKKEPSNL